MRLLEAAEIRLDWSDIHNRVSHPKPSMSRSGGLHLSGVIRYIAQASGILGTSDESEDEMPLRMALGMAWEEWAAGLWPDLSWQPGEIEMDGIIGSPDAVRLDGDRLEVQEFKLTWKSEERWGRDFARRNWMWITQGMGYCYILKTNYCRYHVLWVNGDYRPPSPKYMTYLVQFDDQELRRRWDMILRHKDKAKPE